jgi:hypothetical protein
VALKGISESARAAAAALMPTTSGPLHNKLKEYSRTRQDTVA